MNWQPFMKQRAAEFKIEEISLFIKQAEIASRKRDFSERAWAKLTEQRMMSAEQHSALWQARVDLFRDLEAALGEDPAGATAHALAARWMQQIEAASAGDLEIKAGLLQGWSHRHGWPDSQRWRVEALHFMSFDRFEKCADFLDRAVAAGSTHAD